MWKTIAKRNMRFQEAVAKAAAEHRGEEPRCPVCNELVNKRQTVYNA